MATRTLTRGLSILEALAESGEGGLGPSALSLTVQLDKATVTRLLQTLAEGGYVVQDPATRRYRLGWKILRLAHGAAASLNLRQIAHPHLQALRDRVNETVHLGVMDGLSIVYLDKLESPNSIQLVSAIGQTMPLHSTALGKIAFTSRTARTICSIDEFRADIRRTHLRGYAIDDRENEPMGACVAAAILDAGGLVVGAISVSGPYYRMEEHFEDYGEEVRMTAAAISSEIGGGDNAPSRSPRSPAALEPGIELADESRAERHAPS
jgi:DNA-binding IclR family transcriptional regulator